MAIKRAPPTRKDTRDLAALQGAPRILVAAMGPIRDRILVSLGPLAHVERVVGDWKTSK